MGLHGKVSVAGEPQATGTAPASSGQKLFSCPKEPVPASSKMDPREMKQPEILVGPLQKHIQERVKNCPKTAERNEKN